MRIVIGNRSEKLLDAYDYRDHMTITIDGKQVFDVFDGEPEDANIHVVLHNFSWRAAPPERGEDYEVTRVNGSIRVVRA